MKASITMKMEESEFYKFKEFIDENYNEFGMLKDEWRELRKKINQLKRGCLIRSKSQGNIAVTLVGQGIADYENYRNYKDSIRVNFETSDFEDEFVVKWGKTDNKWMQE